jgi:hypothetical protein
VLETGTMQNADKTLNATKLALWVFFSLGIGIPLIHAWLDVALPSGGLAVSADFERTSIRIGLIFLLTVSLSITIAHACIVKELLRKKLGLMIFLMIALWIYIFKEAYEFSIVIMPASATYFLNDYNGHYFDRIYQVTGKEDDLGDYRHIMCNGIEFEDSRLDQFWFQGWLYKRHGRPGQPIVLCVDKQEYDNARNGDRYELTGKESRYGLQVGNYKRIY